MKSLYLIDLSSFIFRAYYAVRPLSTKTGIPVNAVFGVVSMLNKLIGEKKPDHLVACNDREDKGVRYDIYPQYKANRSEPPEDLIPQFALIHEYVKTYPILAVDHKGYEADDVIATVVKKYKMEKDMEIFIVSSDKDLMQLVDKNVFLYDAMKDVVITEKEVKEKFGVGPENIIDLQSLCGDAVDNVPGISGVGPKTAALLINQYGSLENIFVHADEIKGKLKDKIALGKKEAFLSRKLVKLHNDLDLKLAWDDLRLSQPNKEELNAFFKKLDFNKFIYTDNGSTPTTSQPTQKKRTDTARYTCIDTVEKLKKLCAEIEKTQPPRLAFDTETDSIHSLKAKLVGLSLCFSESEAFYIPIAHKYGQNVNLADIKKYVAPILTDPGIGKVGQNAKFDMNVLSQHNISIANLNEDTLIMSYLNNPAEQHNIDFLSAKYLGHESRKYKDTVPKDKTFADVPIATATDYSAEDAWMTFSLVDPLKKELNAHNLTEIYTTLELPLVVVLATMEQHGVLIDREKLAELKEEFGSRLKQIEKKIHKLAGSEFNINSPKQLAVILFEQLKLPPVKRTKTGYSTDVDVLTVLSKHHELPKKILDYRMIAKLLGTYIEQLGLLINPKTLRIHTNFNQTVAETGRLSSSDPNLQNIPVRTEEGKRIRELFIVPKEFVIFSADYSQIELRLLADFSGDPHLISAYKNDEDIHKKTASKILHVPMDEVTEEQRAIAKTINFGVIYGQSPYGLASMLGVPQSEARDFIEGFYREFSHVRAYKEDVLKKARASGFVTTYLGRRRMLPEILSQNHQLRQNGERAAFNTIFQGSAADLIKKAMIGIHHFLHTENLKTKMILQVHDELLFEVPQSELDNVEKNIPKIMSESFTLKVPLKVSCQFGKNWAEAH